MKLDRKKTIDKGPRSLDLDILLFDEQSLDTTKDGAPSTIDSDEPDLQIPHKSMLERPFVLQPLCEYVALLSCRHFC